MTYDSHPTGAPREPASASPRGDMESTEAAPREISRLSDLSAAQWKSGIAAWLGWLFDGLDMTLYTPVAMPFVALLLGVPDANGDPSVGYHCSLIQAAFMAGWALGGALFGRLGDLLGRSRALSLTILTYAMFTGLGFVAQTWWHLMLFRFLAALGIGGEWAVGASLLSETWPSRWRPWLAAVLQTAVNLGALLAGVAGYMIAALPLSSEMQLRGMFLVGVAPALLVFWIRRAVPEPAEWRAAKKSARHQPGIAELFAGPLQRVTMLTMTVCALSLSGHWAFMFWSSQQLRQLPVVVDWTPAAKTQYVGALVAVVMVGSIIGNFAAAALARAFGYRRAIVGLCLFYAASMWTTYCAPRGYEVMWMFLGTVGLAHGMFGLFTMYLPPLFPPLLRTTGAGFCYNIGRLAAAFGVVYFGTYSQQGDYRLSLLYASFLFVPAAAVAIFLPEPLEN